MGPKPNNGKTNRVTIYEPEIKIKTEHIFDENERNEQENFGNLSEFVDKKVSYFCKKCDYSSDTEVNVMKHIKEIHHVKKIDKIDQNENYEQNKNRQQHSSKKKPLYKCTKCNLKVSRVCAMK